MKFILSIAFSFVLFGTAIGQTIDTIPQLLQEVTVMAYKEEPTKLSPINISVLRLNSENYSNAFNLCDLLSSTAGVSMLSTGNGIAKPVIRGLYGNRILILLNGLKFDNQQWQEEHGLGLTSFGLSKLELIKGPIGILYGSEAIGGVINLIEESRPIANTRQTDFGLTFNSNTLGGMIEAGYKESKQNRWWRFRVGVNNNADYTDGNRQRVLNSRFDGYYLKTTYGFDRKKWSSTNNYSSSFNRFGFIFNDIYDFVEPDSRWSRKLSENPSHMVVLNILSSENKISLRKNLLMNINLGVQSNLRMENEGGGAISLNMHLLTFQNLIKVVYKINQKHTLIFSNLNTFEDNTNYGARKIVPDARLQESNVSANYELSLSPYLILENGIGIGEKWIKTFFTATVNSPDKEIAPFSKQSPYFDFFSGLTYFPNDHFNIKFNLASGVRVANLAELSSNGLHEGIFIYEIGDPQLKNEQIYSVNFFLNFNTRRFSFSLSPFINFFADYIYLAPVDENWFGFPVSRYKQQDAVQYGGEVSVLATITKDLSFKITYAGMNSQTKDGNFTPYTPAQKITPLIRYNFKINSHLPIQSYTNIEYNLAQNNTAPLEIATPEYALWNAGCSSIFQSGDKQIEIGLQVNNILDLAYFDHLSRFKNYGLLNIGRNFLISLKMKL